MFCDVMFELKKLHHVESNVQCIQVKPEPLVMLFQHSAVGWVLANIWGASSLIVPLLTFDTNFSFNLRPAHFKSSIRATFDQNFLWG